jgi:type VI secretion system protein ImpK
LSLAARLQRQPVHPSIGDLRNQLVGEIKGFEARCLQAGVEPEQVRIASYALCSLLDESILNTPWGAQGQWSHQGLLILFHKEAQGGERFFQNLTRLAQQPGHYLHLLEFHFLCLSLGFAGKYRVAPNGLNALEQTRSQLYELIHRVRGDAERDLSPRWQGLQDARIALVRHVPLWVAAAAAGVLMLLVYLGFLFALNGGSDSLFKRAYALGDDKLPISQAVLAPVPGPGKAGRFKPLLADEIAAQRVEVVDDRILRIRNSFLSGSDRIKPEFLPMLQKIAKELERGGDQVLVTGHTDDKSIASARFPSNWALSDARARNVAGVLTGAASLAGQIQAEGRADNEPLAANDSDLNRALNRRVDLLIK